MHLGGRWSWKIEGTGEEGCGMVCGGSGVRGLRVVNTYVNSRDGRDWPGRGKGHLVTTGGCMQSIVIA